MTTGIWYLHYSTAEDTPFSITHVYVIFLAMNNVFIGGNDVFCRNRVFNITLLIISNYMNSSHDTCI